MKEIITPISRYTRLECNDHDEYTDRMIIYHNCGANVLTALKRDCLEVPRPDKSELIDFYDWYDRLFVTEIEPLLVDFNYSYEYWYNNLSRKQQAEIDRCKEKPNQKHQSKMFCKIEKQEVTSCCKNPKNRCICGPNVKYKTVVGPVVDQLQFIFRNFKGFAVGLSFEEKETKYNTFASKGHTMIIEGDGSGFDRTQHTELKYVEHKIYKWLYDRGKLNMPHDIFYENFLNDNVTIKAEVFAKAHRTQVKQKIAQVKREGGVRSGDMDTTFANTLRMIMYNRYILETKMLQHPEAYSLAVGGDDFVACVYPSTDKEAIVQAYHQVFLPIKKFTGPIEHGLGQLLKFLKISDDLADSDFCSTQVFYCKGCKSYKMVRKLDRFLHHTAYSRTALSMNDVETARYCVQLYLANDDWLHGLPILSDYNDVLLKHAVQLLTTKNAIRTLTSKYKVLSISNRNRWRGTRLRHSDVVDQSGVLRLYCDSYFKHSAGFFPRESSKLAHLFRVAQFTKNLQRDGERNGAFKSKLLEPGIHTRRHANVKFDHIDECGQDLARALAKVLDVVVPPAKGSAKRVLQASGSFNQRNYSQVDARRRAYMECNTYITKEDAFKMAERYSKKHECCKYSYRDWIKNRTGITDHEIAKISSDIRNKLETYADYSPMIEMVCSRIENFLATKVF